MKSEIHFFELLKVCDNKNRRGHKEIDIQIAKYQESSGVIVERHNLLRETIKGQQIIVKGKVAGAMKLMWLKYQG